jgi:WD40 repeat protein
MFIIDPATDEVTSVPDQATVSNLGFAQDGELLAIIDSDGTIRLWDVERNTSAGVVWDGSGAVVGSPSWYDPATDTMWLAASGRILQVPLDPAVWVERACGIVGRDFTEDEWDRFVPGDEPLQSACP